MRARCGPWLFLRGSVIDEERDIQILGHTGVNVAQECQELLVPVPPPPVAEDCAGGHVQGGEPGGGPVADRVMRHPFDVAPSQGEHRLGRFNAWTGGFSSTHSPNALSGGLR